LDFVSAKSKKSLVFAQLISELSVKSGDVTPEESQIKGEFFMISSSDPWYGYILVYLHTLKCPTSTSHDEHRRIRHQEKNYLILDDTLYRRGVDCILRHASLMKKWSSFLTNATLEHVVVICLGWKQPKIFYEMITFG
jgi:hypothetical protein